MKGEVTGVTEIKPAEVRLIGIVTGGSPAADTFTWILPDGTVLHPGQTAGIYRASEVKVSSTAIVAPQDRDLDMHWIYFSLSLFLRMRLT